ncbi:putative extracellular sulfatase Sulf-1-like protein [Diplonema papillatum]|nr:putative extracellular sulfatase Sulf-1-like protein [Diplonema papillatum]
MTRFAQAWVLAVVQLLLLNRAASAGAPCADCPNIVLLLSQQQDILIGGWAAMNKTKTLLKPLGTHAAQFRVHTPLSAPSRAQLQTGKYLHNIKSGQPTPASKLFGTGGVASIDLGGKVYPSVFPTILREQQGYVTGIFGKCMDGGCGVNTQGGSGFNSNETADLRLMGAFDRWFEALDDGQYANGSFFDTSAAGCSFPWNETACTVKTAPGGAWAGLGDGYDTATIANATIEWIKEVAQGDQPFFAYMAPYAAVAPAIPAPWYTSGTACDNATFQNDPSWNFSGMRHTACSAEPPKGNPVDWPPTDYHEIVSCPPGLTADEAAALEVAAQDRCKAFMSVDDAFAGVYEAVEAAGVMNNTYFIVTSDQGYNQGHHMLLSDANVVYEHALNVETFVVGPGVQEDSFVSGLFTTVDLAPTILGFACVDTPADMDGKSLVSTFAQNATDPELSACVKAHISGHPPPNRTSVPHEFFNQGPLSAGGASRPLDDWSNTYIGVTYQDASSYYKYALFDPKGTETAFAAPYMREMFDLAGDPYETRNIYNDTLLANESLVKLLEDAVHTWYQCSGKTCS